MGRRRRQDRRRSGPRDGRMQGVLIVDKPEGLSSGQVVSLVKRLLLLEKVGHGGTLDPLATGVLPLFLNTATRLAGLGLKERKAYVGTIRLGQRSDTLDSQGEILEEREWAHVTDDEIDRAINALRGPIKQVPPMYSAKKVDGQRLYRLARQNVEIEREAKDVVVYRLDLLGREGRDLVVEVECSAGTYVRSIADDLGRALGCGALLAALRRTSAGSFGLQRAITLDEIREHSDMERSALQAHRDEHGAAPPFDPVVHCERWHGFLGDRLLSVDEALPNLARVDLASELWASRLRQGQAIEKGDVNRPLRLGFKAGDQLLVMNGRRCMALVQAAVDAADLKSCPPRAPVFRPTKLLARD